MAAVTAPGGRRSLLGKLSRDLSALARRKGRPSKLAAVIQEHLLVTAGLGTAVTAIWHSMGTMPGGIAVFVACVILDYKITAD